MTERNPDVTPPLAPSQEPPDPPAGDGVSPLVGGTAPPSDPLLGSGPLKEEEPPAQGDTAPAPHPDSLEAESDEGVGITERGQVASSALVALGRAARSFLLYEPDNEAIRKFLEMLREKMWVYLENYGPLALQIRPWEMLLGQEIVYLNRDRERSLAFRLFRDGVRRVIFQPELEWDELTSFLGIISIRYTGIRQQEDDIVTLLWKAGFRHIVVESVEGFVPEDEDTEVEMGLPDTEAGGPDADAGQDNYGSIFGSAPRDFTAPWPEYTDRAPLAWQVPDALRLKELGEEDSSLALPAQCVRLVQEILDVAANPVEPMEFGEAYPIIQEIRDFLLSEGLLSSLLELVRVLRRASVRPDDEEARQELISAVTDARSLARVVRTVPAGVKDVPQELMALVELIPGDPLPLLVDILARERASGARAIARKLLVRLAADRLEDMARLVPRVEDGVKVDLLQVIAEVELPRAVTLAVEIGGSEDVGLQLAALNILEQGPHDATVARRLTTMVEASSLEVRLRAIRLLAQRRERWSYHALSQRMEAHDLDLQEAEVLGEALAAIWPRRALQQFQAWLNPKQVLRKVIGVQQALKWGSVTGLALIPGDPSEETIREVARTAGEALHRHCMQCIVRHRHLNTESAGD